MEIGKQTFAALFQILIEDDSLQMAGPADASNGH